MLRDVPNQESRKGRLTKKLIESYEDVSLLEQDKSSLQLPSKMPSAATVEQWIVRAIDIKELFKSIENNHSELEKSKGQLKDFQQKIWLTKSEDWTSKISNINQIEKLVNDIKIIKIQLDTIIIEHPDIDKSALVKRRDLFQSQERLLSRWLSTGVKPITIKSERSNLWVVGAILLIAGLLCILSFSSPLLGGIAMLCAGFFLSVLRPSSEEDSSSASGPFKFEVQEQYEEKFGKSVQKWTEMVVTDHIAKCREEIIEIQRNLDRFKTIEIQNQKRQKLSKSLEETKAKLKVT